MSRPALFDRRAVVSARRRAGSDGLFLFNEVAERVADRLLDIQRTFPVMADLSGRGDITHQLSAAGVLNKRAIGCVLRLVDRPMPAKNNLVAVADQETFPLGDASIDLAVSVLALHSVNDLPGTLVQMRRALRPDGLLLAALFGGETLWELRGCLERAEIEVTGGVSPRVSPFADVRELGGLLQRAGFALPVSDQDRVTTTYSSALDLMRDLRSMGETNSLVERSRHFMRRTILRRTAELYQSRYVSKGRIPATFDIAYLTGWAPHESQQKPLRPGQSKVRLAEALGAAEHSAGEKASPED